MSINRISWNEFFSQSAILASKRSPCERLQVGCVLVKDNRIISTGYNGFLPGAEHISIIVNDHEQATVHAEQNCIADCSKRGINTEGAIVYCTHHPCINCFKLLIAAGIKEINYLKDYKNDENIYKINNSLNIKINKLQ